MAKRTSNKKVKKDEREPLSIAGTCPKCEKGASVNFGVLPDRLDLVLPVVAFCRDCQMEFNLDDVTKGM